MDIRWADFLLAIDLIPVPFPSSATPSSFIEQLEIDAVLLSGGNDLAALVPDPLNERRDQVEQALLAEALKRELPVVGICRGAQFLAQQYGSKLIEVANHVKVEHSLEVVQGSAWAKDLATYHSVNSFHRYAVSRLGADLIPLAVVRDGSIEAFMHKSLRILGLLWHPERNSQPHATDQRLFKYFLGQSDQVKK